MVIIFWSADGEKINSFTGMSWFQIKGVMRIMATDSQSGGLDKTPPMLPWPLVLCSVHSWPGENGIFLVLAIKSLQENARNAKDSWFFSILKFNASPNWKQLN